MPLECPGWDNQNVMLQKLEFASDAFDQAVYGAFDDAIAETLAAGVPVFYMDGGIDIMELPDHRKFEIRLIPGAPRSKNYEVLRELVFAGPNGSGKSTRPV